VPYLRNDGHPHDFSHIIHQFAFEGDDEYDFRKARLGREMRQRMGLGANPLDGSMAEVRFECNTFMFMHEWKFLD
jgi:endoplasmic reticulum-Golgi intermediate compartment protein 3